MLENQFIQFASTSISAAEGLPRLPFKFNKTEIFVAKTRIFPLYPSGHRSCTLSAISIVDKDGNVKSQSSVSLTSSYGNLSIFSGGSYINSFTYGGVTYTPKDGDVLYLRLTYYDSTAESDRYAFSQPMVYTTSVELEYVRYRCNEDAFNFPFKTVAGSYAGVYIPIRMYAPQYGQDDKTYVDANGIVTTLYAKYYKEWECRTEFLSEAMHDLIITALSCDEVYIGGIRVSKSDKYQIDWENHDLDCDGSTKLGMATFKVRENVTQRNSNY